LAAGGQGDELGAVRAFGDVRQRATTTGDERSVEFWVPTEFLGDILAPWKWSGLQPPSWDVKLREAIPLTLDVEAFRPPGPLGKVKSGPLSQICRAGTESSTRLTST
jgi:hypothetical protein